MSDAAPGCSLKTRSAFIWDALLEQFILTLTQAVKESFAVDRLHSTALNVIVAAIKHFGGLLPPLSDIQLGHLPRGRRSRGHSGGEGLSQARLWSKA